MPPYLALLIYGAFCVWLVYQDIKRRPEVSSALWVPLLWFLILGSRPVSFWFGWGAEGSVEAYAEGSPVDRAIFVSLILAGVVVLARRHVVLGELFKRNPWLFVFYLFWLLSVSWSDFPFVAFKRWVKELGNIVMVMVVLTERNPEEALKAMLLRFAYVLMPLSVVVIKYFPELGRTYNPWTWERMVTGVTTQKNTLGCITYLSLMCIGWLWLLRRDGREAPLNRWEKAGEVGVLVMACWLLHLSNSATSLACGLLGLALVLVLRLPFFRLNLARFQAFVIVGIVIALVLNFGFNLKNVIIRGLGRDVTLTTRTDLWDMLLKSQQDPLLGTGYQSYWLGARLDKVWTRFEGINQAHNGYLEVYLNGGYVGVALLSVLLISIARRLMVGLPLNPQLGAFRLAFFCTVLLYNYTEATFARLSITWFAFLLLTLVLYPETRASEVTEIETEADAEADAKAEPKLEPRPA